MLGLCMSTCLCIQTLIFYNAIERFNDEFPFLYYISFALTVSASIYFTLSYVSQNESIFRYILLPSHLTLLDFYSNNFPLRYFFFSKL